MFPHFANQNVSAHALCAIYIYFMGKVYCLSLGKAIQTRWCVVAYKRRIVEHWNHLKARLYNYLFLLFRSCTSTSPDVLSEIHPLINRSKIYSRFVNKSIQLSKSNSLDFVLNHNMYIHHVFLDYGGWIIMPRTTSE